MQPFKLSYLSISEKNRWLYLQVIIRNAKELYKFAENTIKEPAPSRYQSECVKVKCRIFFYDDNILHNRRDRFFVEIGNRAIHAITSTDGGCSVSSRQLSCYCDACLDCQYESCKNSAHVDEWEDGHHSTVVTT